MAAITHNKEGPFQYISPRQQAWATSNRVVVMVRVVELRGLKCHPAFETQPGYLAVEASFFPPPPPQLRQLLSASCCALHIQSSTFHFAPSSMTTLYLVP
jgi:hypothetical protein